MATKNLGQVAGVHIGNTPPENTILIWFDNTPSQRCHKVYDAAKKTWVILDQNIVSLITYSELVNIAKNVGLSIGKFYQIKDKANALALAITTTKVQYDDAMGNILIDDLGSNIQYHVTSQNLSIDDIRGVFNESNKTLVFRFDEQVPDFTANDYILGKVQRNNVWSLAKYQLSSFLSKVTGNSVTWNGGFYFNFSNTLKNYLDKKGGVVSKDTYDTDMNQLNLSIQNVGKANQQIIDNANKAITDATTPTVIYDKQLPSALETGGEAIDIAKGDKLVTIISKIQRYINRFKYATGIKLTSKFSEVSSSGKVNNNDSLETAIAKLQNQQSNIHLSLPNEWEPETVANQNISAGDSYDLAFGKIQADRQIINSLEHPLDTVVLYNPVIGENVNLKFRIQNGMLEIYIESFVKVEWIYTRIIANDYTKFIPFLFDDDLFNKILPFFNIPNEDYYGTNAYRMIPLTTISLAKVGNSEGEWITSNFDVRALVSLAYSKVGGDNVDRIGLSLTPISKIFMNNNELKIEEVNGGMTFQDILQNSQVRYYIPPMVIRYKLF
jgi:hypothetical protein